jgi:predicted 2-oxoglutarate/Fe(II)-dependent dioxygenase YbiX
LDTHPPPANLFIAQNFLDIDVCRELRAEAEQSVTAPAEVTKTTGRVDISMRQTSRLSFSADTEELINAYLRQLKPQLEKYYDVQLSGFEKFQFLLYCKGDFYKRHADRNDKPESPDYIKARRISVVVFLSNENQTEQPDSYTGGTLVVWNSGIQKTPLRIEGEVGKLIAFPSDLMHEVEPVRSGKRYSIVNWFFEESGSR